MNEFDRNAEKRFGRGIKHVGNYDIDQENLLREAILKSNTSHYLFVNDAYAVTDIKLSHYIGLYSRGNRNMSKFWKEYNNLKENIETMDKVVELNEPKPL